MRLIDADKIDFNEVFIGASEFAKDTREAAQMLIDNQPTVEAVPVVHGEWIKTDKGITHNVNTWKVERQFSYECPLCGYHTGNQGKYFNFCPNCGADMRKKV